MFEEEKTIPTETTQEPTGEDAFLRGLFSDEDIIEETDAGMESTTGGDGAEVANQDPIMQPEAPASEGTEENGAPEDTNPGAAEELIDLVYNGQNQSLPRSEVIKLAQKGMNYDHVKGQLDGLKNSPAQSMLAKLASDAGTTPDAYLEQVLGAITNRQAEEFANAEGISPELAQRLLGAENKVREYETAAEKQKTEERNNQMFQRFARNHPDVRPEDIPREVWEKVAAGDDIESAFAAHENVLLQDKVKTLEAAIAQMNKNETNKQTAVGSLRGSKSAATEDAFLEGLFG